MVLSVPEGRMVFVTGLEGGVEHNFGGRWNKATFPYLSHSSVVISCESALPCRTGEKDGDESDPPKKWGGHVTLDSGTVEHASIRPHGVALVLIYPCGKARKQPPRRGAESTETDL